MSPVDVNPWAVGKRFGMRTATARQALHRLTKRVPPVAYRSKRGFYAAVSALARELTDYDDFLRLGFHAIEGIADCHEILGEGSRRVRQRVTALFASPSFRRNPANRSLVYDGEWDGRPQTVQLTTRDRLQVSLRASEQPLDLLEFFSYLHNLPSLFGIPPPLWRLSFDINEDHEGKLKVGPFSWSQAVGFVRVYWKRALRRTRVEVRDHRGVSLEGLLPAVERVLTALLELEKEGRSHQEDHA